MGCNAVLGRVVNSSKHKDIVPIYQHLVTQKLRPGSGQLEILTKMDGPIRTVQICDIKLKTNEIILAPDLMWSHASFNNRQIIDKGKPQTSYDYQVCDIIIYTNLNNIFLQTLYFR